MALLPRVDLQRGLFHAPEKCEVPPLDFGLQQHIIARRSNGLSFLSVPLLDILGSPCRCLIQLDLYFLVCCLFGVVCVSVLGALFVV